MNLPIRVGIVGAHAERGWARDAHIPALKSMPQDFSLVGVSARTQEIADSARTGFGALKAFGNSRTLVCDAAIDLVSVCVKVPEHRAIVLDALAAGKHVYCEWPLGRDLTEARAMADAVPIGQHAVVGLQALSADPVRRAIGYVQEGRIGALKVIRVVSPTVGWGAQAPSCYAYLQDRDNGATLATIAGGHTLAVVEALVGAYSEVDARNSILHPRPRIYETNTLVERTCADYMAILGAHASGCVSTVEIRGGCSDPFQLELIGDRGWIRLSGKGPGGFQTAALQLDTSFPQAPEATPLGTTLQGPPLYLAASYARFKADICTGQHTLPDFNFAVRLTRLLDTIDNAAEQGRRQYL